MILRILTLVCAICIYPSLGKLDEKTFIKNFEDMCFQNEPTDPFRINGQEAPLSSTIENFIALAEKFEVSNPSLQLKEELAYFISEYVYENIKILNGNTDQWKMGRADFKALDAMWDPDVNGYLSSYIDPFSDDEKCSLYNMISHSVLTKDVPLLRSAIPGNLSSPARSVDLNPDDYRPQELGVVAIAGTEISVSLSKVLIGLYVGLKNERTSDLTTYDSFQSLKLTPEDELPQDTTVDALFAVTLADVLMLSEWTGNERPGLAKNGNWVSIPLGTDKKIDGFCPMAYVQPEQGTFIPAYSYSSVRGAADGLILGLAVKQVYDNKNNAKLSQILRMYYSPDGITVKTRLDEINANRISFCRRNDAVSFLEGKLQNQMLLYGYLIAQNKKDVIPGFQKAKNLYAAEKGNIFRNDNKEIRDCCERPTSLEKPEDLPREIFLDVIVVMDSSISENAFQEQQLITGYLAKHLDLRYTGSRMTILLDQKVTSGVSTSAVRLNAFVSDTYSSSCAACMVGQFGYEQSTLERDQVITGIDHFLQERKQNETKYSGVNGKVVIYFNYENDEGRGNNKVQGRLEKALRDLHLNHQDVTFYAVGLDSELLKKYAKNDPSLVFLGTDGTQEEVAKRLFSKISFAPALLQYEDCKEAKNEKGATYENFVSPHTIQHYEMPAEYFYKSRSLSFTFESNNGYIQVCHNRATARPENEIRNCKNTTGNTGIEFKLSNPCQSFTKETCAPFYFSVMGMESNSHDMKPDTRTREYCTDIHNQWCRTLDQVKFKVSHQGVRCSGCLGLGAPPTVILFTVLLTYFIYKRF